MITDLHLISELYGIIGGLSPEKVRQKLILCSMELSGTNPTCSLIVSNAMSIALQGGNVKEYLEHQIKKLLDTM
jgi:hypothetical protein